MSTTKCPSCGADAAGKFCASCGAPLAGAACATCRAPLTPGAKFCHRCGAPASAQAAPRHAGVPNALPWTVAAIALLALVALAAGQRFARPIASASGEASADPAASMPSASDISAMSPAEQAERLYDRIMSAAERGKTDSVRFFLPMALQIYQSLGNLTVDQHYDLGRLAEVSGDPVVAAAQADTILKKSPQHLLGLVLASGAARLRGDAAAERRFLERLSRNEIAERQRQLPEYQLHRNDIDRALADYRRSAR